MSCRIGLLVDPLGMTGFVLVRFANLYWLVTVSGFQGSSCSGFPAYPAVLSAACRLCCVRRQGDTLRIRRIRVNGFLKLSAADIVGLFEVEYRGKQERLPDLPGRRDSCAAPRKRRLFRYGFSRPILLFNTHSGFSTTSGAVLNSSSVRTVTQEVFESSFECLPRNPRD